ncbi:hypothetical protein [Arenimonas sp. SCN 70-307]|uniref:hypothetical protein n=1 Tax=Arenimonas sp. SCN 70-307 TaxID=1660089 RepID=UPI0025C3A3A1|nr:hypothetical protein [Arenimonas sp. SCN 70-307]
MSIDDRTLMAYADGQLDAAEAARVEAAVAADPALAAALAGHRALAGALRDAYAPVLDEPVPAALQALLREPEAAANVASLADARARRAAPPRFGLPAWIGVAAALALGLGLGVLLGREDPALGLGPGGQMVARGEFARALEQGLASQPVGDVAIGLSFRDDQGRWCRSFVRGGEAPLAGLACRSASGDWQLPALGEASVSGGDLRQAAADLPPSVLAEVDARLQGEPLDAEAERAARDDGWR